MNKVLVIGYGNTLRGDDAAGVRAVELIAKRHPEVVCVCLHQLMPELAEQIAEYDIVFFLDAEVDITKPNVRLLTPGIDADQRCTHFITPESILSLSKQLFQHVPLKAYIIGIPASQFDFSESLSERTATAVEECATLIEQMI
jgi:hydrogenase maturation protease